MALGIGPIASRPIAGEEGGNTVGKPLAMPWTNDTTLAMPWTNDTTLVAPYEPSVEE